MDRDKEILKVHKTSFLNKDKPTIGAYCFVKKIEGEKVLTVMTKKQIENSWNKAKTDKVQEEKDTTLSEEEAEFVESLLGKDESMQEQEAIQKDLGIIPNFEREKGMENVAEIEEAYPF